MTNGKGSRRRCDKEAESKYRQNYDRIFIKGKRPKVLLTLTGNWYDVVVGKSGKMIDLTAKVIKRKNKRGAK